MTPEEMERLAANMTPEELAERAMREAHRYSVEMEMASVALTCLRQFVLFLIEKKVIDPQETLDLFANVSDGIQQAKVTAIDNHNTALATGLVESICREIAETTGAKRRST